MILPALPVLLRSRTGRLVLLSGAMLAGAAALQAQPYTFTTIAGTPGRNGTEDGPRAPQFWNPSSIARDSAGNFYVADTQNNTIRKITSAGVVTTFAGKAGVAGSIDGVGTEARFYAPRGVAVDSAGNVYVADTGNQVIRKITPAGVVTLLAGTVGVKGSANGPGSAARFNFPQTVAVDSVGNVYVADGDNHTIRRITSAGDVTTWAGITGTPGNANGGLGTATFSEPLGVAINPVTNDLYVADAGSNNSIRRVSPSGVVSTVATGFNRPLGIVVDAAGASVYFADYSNHVIRRLTTSNSTVSVWAGSIGNFGLVDDPDPNIARFNSPRGVTVDPSGNVFVADMGNHTIRRISSTREVTTFTGPNSPGITGSADGGPGSGARFKNPTGVAVNHSTGDVYVGDSANHTIRKITRAGVTSTLAGSPGTFTPPLQNGQGGNARFYTPTYLAVHQATGDIYVTDQDNAAIRKVTTGGVVTTVASGPAANFTLPTGVAVDATATFLYVADFNSHTIRRVTISTGSVSVYAGTLGVSNSQNGNGTAASFNGPEGVALDGAGNLYVVDSNNQMIRKITPNRDVTILAGTAGVSGSVDGTGTAAQFRRPVGLTVDGTGTNLYVADSGNATIRRVTTNNGTVTTLGGSVQVTGSTDGTGTAARFNNPYGVAMDSAGSLYVADFNNQTIRSGALATPVMTSPTTATMTVGQPFTYTATFSGILPGTAGGPFTYNGLLPAGVSFNASTGVLSGAPSVGGTFPVTIGATNGAGAGYGTVTLTTGSTQVAPAITTQPQSQTVDAGVGVVVAFSVVATGTPEPTYQWRKDGNPINDQQIEGKSVFGATESTLSLVGVTPTDAGSYTVVVSNGVGTPVTSSAATLTVPLSAPKITTQPESQVRNADSTAQIFIIATGNPTPTFQWRKNGNVIAGATEGTLTLAPVVQGDAGVYTVVVSNALGSVTSREAVLGVIEAVPNPPIIYTPPTSQVVPAGNTATMTVVVTGFPRPTLQWRKDGNAIAGATNSTLSLPAVTAADTGVYTVVATNNLGTVTSPPAVLAVTAPAPTAPAITTQPQAQVVSAGANVTLSVVASGFPVPTYQWRKDGNAISGATASSLVLNSVAANDTASYTVVVSNSQGSVTSAAAVLAVTGSSNIAPAIAQQPASQAVAAGSNVTFAVTATGTPAPTYQWSKDGSAVAGATASSLTLNAVTATTAGGYSVVATNSAGSATSAAASLTVNPGSALANLSLRTTMATGQTLIVGAVVSGGAKNILIRAAGPALAGFGLVGMVDPRLDLYTGGAQPTATNDDWPAALAPTFAAVGAFGFPAVSRDAALTQTINGSFTVQARGTGPGVILVEAYDVSGGIVSRLINLSARNQVGTGAEILIAGLNISGTGTKRVLIRGVGPGLAAFGVNGTLADPRVQVFAGTTVIATNDNWDAALVSTFAQVGAFGLQPGSRDAALLVTLNAGTSYTVQVSGADGGTGEALVEVYEVP